MALTTNQEWLDALRQPDNSAALEELRRRLERGLRYAISARIDSGQLDDVVEDFSQDAVLKVLESLDSFRGESQFITWATKIAVRVAFSELRRKRWQDISIEKLVQPEREDQDFTPAALADRSPTPEVQASRVMLMEKVLQMMDETLSDRQRTALQAVMDGGLPAEEVAHQLGTNRNALYKMLHDARLKMQARLAKEGLNPQELLAMFDET